MIWKCPSPNLPLGIGNAGGSAPWYLAEVGGAMSAVASELGDDYHVFLSPEGPSKGLYVTNRTSAGFEVREQGEGHARIGFSCRIMHCAAVPTQRFEPIEMPSELGVRTPSRASAEQMAEATPTPPLRRWPCPSHPHTGTRRSWPPDIMRDGTPKLQR